MKQFIKNSLKRLSDWNRGEDEPSAQAEEFENPCDPEQNPAPSKDIQIKRCAMELSQKYFNGRKVHLVYPLDGRAIFEFKDGSTGSLDAPQCKNLVDLMK